MINPYTFVAPAATYSAAVLADSPLAYYRLGEASGTTMTDSSGNGRSGTYAGSPTLGATGLVTGDSDTAVTFNGTNYGEVPYASWMNTLSAFTIEAIIKPGSVTGTRTIACRHASTGGSQWVLRLEGTALVSYIYNGGFPAATASTTFVIGTKYHVASTYDGSTITVYVNGTSAGSAAASGKASATSVLDIGAARTGFSNGIADQFSGVIDEVAYYGTALSSTRIAAHAALV
jgi:hypothetical protein